MKDLRFEDYPLRRKILAVLVVAFCLGATFLTFVLLLGSCSANLEGTLRQDGSARIDFLVETPGPIAAKLRRLAEAGGGAGDASAPLFSAEILRASLAAKPELGLIELAQPEPDTLKGAIAVRSLARLAESPELAGSGLLTVVSGPDWSELRVRLARGQAKALSTLLPGVDPYLLDALSPPALDEEGGDISAAEYRTMLKSVLGEKAMPSMEEAAVAVSLAAPGKVFSSGGGKLEGNTLKVKISVIDVLVLERPIEFWIRWKTR